METSLGFRLREIRKNQGLTQEAVAEQLGFAPEYISRIENNRVQPSWRFLVAFANLLRVSVIDLLSAAGLIETVEVNEADLTRMVAAYPRLAEAFAYARRLNDNRLLADLARYADMLIREKEAENEREQSGGSPAEDEE